jgi:hypothetical protein
MKVHSSIGWKKDPQRWATAIAMHGATEKPNSGNTEVNGSASRIPKADDMMRSWSLKAVFDAWNRMKNRLNQRRTHRLAILQSIESLGVGPQQMCGVSLGLYPLVDFNHPTPTKRWQHEESQE